MALKMLSPRLRELRNGFYVYRFVDFRDNIIYVGRTKNLPGRMSYHFSKRGHLQSECYESIRKIEFVELKTNTDMKIMELYYINKWAPKFNIKDTNSEPLTLKIDDAHLSWRRWWRREDVLREGNKCQSAS